jgi:hypothetical protein
MKRANFILLIALSLAQIAGAAEGGKEAGEERAVARLEIESATVGKPARISWLLADPKTGKARAALLSLAIIHLEKGTRIFSLTRVPTDGHFTMSFHFTDGAGYRVRSVAEIDGMPPIFEERVISVTAPEPPENAVIPSLFFFLTVIAFGLAVGRFSRKKSF